MGESLITRRAGAGGGEATITFENYSHATNLAHTGASALSSARSYLAGASVGGYALFAGGAHSSNYSTVDAYNMSLTRSTPTTLSVVKYRLAGASVGKYALFAGGEGSGYSATVDVYYGTLDISSFPGTKYKLNTMSQEATSTSFETLFFSTPVNGYMKIQNATLQN